MTARNLAEQAERAASSPSWRSCRSTSLSKLSFYNGGGRDASSMLYAVLNGAGAERSPTQIACWDRLSLVPLSDEEVSELTR